MTVRSQGVALMGLTAEGERPGAEWFALLRAAALLVAGLTLMGWLLG